MIQVTLATPTRTPGRDGSKVTVLCPQFSVGANTDVWDEALGSSTSLSSSLTREKRRTKAETLEGVQAEAGKVWERGRNWTSVVIELIPGILTDEGDKENEGRDEDCSLLELPVFVRVEYDATTDEGSRDDATSSKSRKSGGAGAKEGGEKEEDGVESKDKKEKRELAYWAVVGVAKVDD